MKDYVALSRRHFDQQAQMYDAKNTASYSKYPKISCRDVAQRLEGIPYRTLLDVGCGTGYLLELLKNRQEADYYGLDLSPRMLAEAGARLSGSVSLTEGGADHLPYADAFFDVVTCVQSFHHYPYPEAAMAEVLRVLKPGGYYILSDTGYSGLLKRVGNQLLKLSNAGDYAAYNVEDIRALMTGAGFRVECAEPIARFLFTVIGRKP